MPPEMIMLWEGSSVAGWSAPFVARGLVLEKDGATSPEELIRSATRPAFCSDVMLMSVVA